MNYQELWDSIAARPNWREYILPQRSREAFDDEGRMQAEHLDFPPGLTVLDYGCGTGRVLRHINAKRRIGVDVSARFLAIAASHGIETILSDGTSIDLPDNSVDVAYSLMVFQHCEKDDHPAMLSELTRVARLVLVQFPRPGYYKDMHGTHTYTREEVQALGGPSASVEPWSLARYSDGSHPNREWLLTIDASA